MIEIGDKIAFLYVLIYAFLVTVITAFKSEVLRTDFINMLRFDWKVISGTFTGTKEIITLIADSVNDMENTGLAKVLHVVIIVLLTIIAVGIASAVIYGIVRFVIYFIQECVEEYMGMSFWAMTLTDLAGCVFIGKDICSVDDHHWNIWAVFTGLIILYLFAEAIAFSDKQNWRH
ncbi:MAG: hypothetical protein J6N70_14925 [Oribacterium sp.]|nr:hypothetical protein [Oribacterium sp.]